MLKIVKAGIEWGAAFDEAEARYIVWDNVKIGEMYVTKDYSLYIEIYRENRFIVTSTPSHSMILEIEDLPMMVDDMEKGNV